MKSRRNIGFLFLCAIFFSSCSSTRYVPEGGFWLKKSRINLINKDEHLSRSDFVTLQKQMPNSKLFGYPLKLKLYSSVDIRKQHWWSRVMQRSGEAPVVFDTLYANQSALQMKQYLINKGHFESSVHYVCDTLGSKKIGITYFVLTGEGYHYRNASIEVKDDSLKGYFNNWAPSFLQAGEPYDVEALRSEQERISRRLQNRGYYYFNKDDVSFEVDSSLNAHLMDVKMIINLPKSGNHNRRYRHGDIYLYPDENPNIVSEKKFDTTLFAAPKSHLDTTPTNYYFVHAEPLQIKPNVVASKLMIKSGEAYNLTNIDRTYENLLDLRVYRSINLSLHPGLPDNSSSDPLLHTAITLRQSPIWTTESNFDVTTTENLQGVAAYTMLQNRNLFGGAEIFSLRLRGLVELQYLLNKKSREENELNFINNVDLKLESSIEFPRFISPFRVHRFSQNRPRTLFNIGYSYRFYPSFYNRSILNASFSYSWRRLRTIHALSLLDVNSVKIDLAPEFSEQIRTLSAYNQRLRYQYENHFIVAARYMFNYTGRQGNRPVGFNAFRFSIETSGHALNLLSKVLKASKNSEGRYQFLGISYAQYIRIEAEVKRNWNLNEQHWLVTRLMVGSGFAEGNSNVLPYEKGFFAGGNNNIRAWPMNRLGPGSYRPENNNIEQIGDIVGVANLEYRFPIFGAFKGAWFLDVGNIWLQNDNESFKDGGFIWKEVPKDLAIGGGFGLRWDLNFFVIRLDAALPIRNPAKPDQKKWVLGKTQFRDFVLNFGIGYPF